MELDISNLIFPIKLLFLIGLEPSNIINWKEKKHKKKNKKINSKLNNSEDRICDIWKVILVFTLI